MIDGSNRRTLILVGGTMLAAVVALLLLTQLGPKNPTGITKEEKLGGTGRTPKAGDRLTPDDVKNPNRLDAPNILLGEVPSVPAGKAKGFVYESPDDEGHLALRIIGGTTEPMPNGMIHIPNPEAWMYLSDDRMIHMTADEAEIAGTELDPESGTMIGHVLIQIYERGGVSDMRNAELSSLPLLAEITTERINLDREINRISTTEAFTVRTKRFAMAGVGLTAIYNESDKRIEQLRIEERRSIVYRPPQEKKATGSAIANTIPESESEKWVMRRNENGRQSDRPGRFIRAASWRAAAGGEAEDAANSQVYHVVLSEGIRIGRGWLDGGESATGKTLSADFRMGSGELENLVGTGGNKRINTIATTSAPGVPNFGRDAALNANASRRTSRHRRIQRFGSAQSMTVGARILLASAIATMPQPTTQAATTSVSIIDRSDNGFPGDVAIVNEEDISVPLESTEGIEKEDIVILGEGPLELRPIDDSASRLGDGEGMFAILEGEPVVLNSNDGSAICGRVEYSGQNTETKLFPAEANSVEIRLSDGNVATTAAPVIINTVDGFVDFTGAGAIESHEIASGDVAVLRTDDEKNDGGGNDDQGGFAPPATQPGRMDFSGNISASWSESVHLTFTSDSSTEQSSTELPTGTNSGGGMGRISSAEFRGDVRFEHSYGYTLEADRLTAHFNDFNGLLDDSAIAIIQGNGHVRVYGQEGEVSADRMEVTFALDRPLTEGSDPMPSVIEFTGQVAATDTANTLHAGYLRVDLLMPSDMPEDDPNGDRIRLITATDHVRFDLEGGAFALGDRMEARPREGLAKLTGESVIFGKDTMRVAVREVDLNQTDRTADVQGAGMMTYLQVDEPPSSDDSGDRYRDSEDVWKVIRERLDRPRSGADKDTSQPAASDGSMASARGASESSIQNAVRIRWSKSMTFHDGENEGLAEFYGDVLAESSPRPEDYNSIQADRLTFRLTGQIEEPNIVTAEGSNTPASTRTEVPGGTGPNPAFELGLLNGNGGSGRHLIEMKATGDGETPAKVQAVRYADAARTSHVSIFYISGPIIQYMDASQLLNVIGDGSMFLFDGRNDGSDGANRQPDKNADDKQVRFSGKGRTLFKWTGSMLLNGVEQSMTIRDDVSVRHRPIAGKNEESGSELPAGSVDMWCGTLQASMGTGSAADEVDVLSMSGQSTGDLKSLDATGSVVIISDQREVTADRLHFESSTKMAVLEGSEIRPVTVTRSDSPTSSLEAVRVFWDMFADSITIEKPGAATIPSGGG